MLSVCVFCALAILGLPPGLSLTRVRLPGQLLPLAGAGSALSIRSMELENASAWWGRGGGGVGGMDIAALVLDGTMQV